MAESAVQFFVPDSFGRTRSLRSKLETREAELITFLVTGHSVTDFADYKFRVGKIEGLREAIDMCLALEDGNGAN